MNPVRILLVDFSPIGSMGRKLRDVLQSSASLGVHLARESIDYWSSGPFEHNFSRITSQYKPDLLLIVLPQTILKKTDDLLNSMSKKSSELPVAAFFETESSVDVMTLMLKFGTIDFITGPLTTANVLPLVWRLLSNMP